ncbi:MAG: DUF4469 domain-containing protein [Treponema sp.]|nr:DUF4469 domain-containing protein [Treponema sp.]
MAVNEPKTLKVVVPAELVEGTAYQIAVETMSSSKNSGILIKKVRDLHSDFMLVAV